ncbi:SPOR domain-containing protein [Mesobacillus maritimus]|uniref:SPOR domain-containing protein n=1 Tax=Mesobacillus maritimus TaxID=1643336 RepID=UPI00203F0953|nr:SPOR domain-containing protein [Mesobacillus maritimus]MCM3669911.1 SPOR domain-containing protein [Mesobacillus maritimus]
MDKQNTINIKINGKDRPLNEDKPKQDSKSQEQTETNSKPKIKAWDETAAAKDSTEDSFDWVLPENIGETKPGTKAKKEVQRGMRLPGLPKNMKTLKKSRQNVPMVQGVVLNILLAVVIGLGFGTIILKTVQSTPSDQVATEVVAPAPQKETGAAGTTGAESVEVSAISTFVVQGGAFSQQESANNVATELKGKGIEAAPVEVNGQFLLLLGTASSIEEAKALGEEYASKGADVFAKQLDLASFSVSNLSKEEREVLTIAPKLFASLSSGDQSQAKSVEEQVAKLKAIDSKKLKNEQVVAAKKHLEQGASALLAKNNTELQKENIAFLSSWQSLGK